MTKKNSQAEDAATFWASVERSAAAVRELPTWMRVGVEVDPNNFVTFRSDEAAGKKR